MIRHGALAIAGLCLLAGCGGTSGTEQPKSGGETATPVPAPSATPSQPTEAATTASVTPPSPGLCAPTEEVVFACQLKEGRSVAVCGTKGPGGKEFAQYRFGWMNRAPELVWPASGGGEGLTFASVPYSGGGEAQLSFARGDVRYVVYSRVYRTNFKAGEPNDPAFEDGVAVLRGGKLVSDLRCDEATVKPIDYDRADKLVHRDDEAMTDIVKPGD